MKHTTTHFISYLNIADQSPHEH